MVTKYGGSTGTVGGVDQDVDGATRVFCRAVHGHSVGGVSGEGIVRGPTRVLIVDRVFGEHVHSARIGYDGLDLVTHPLEPPTGAFDEWFINRWFINLLKTSLLTGIM